MKRLFLALFLVAASSEAALSVKAWKPAGSTRFLLQCIADAVIDLPTCASVNDGFDCRVLATNALYLCDGATWSAVGGGGGVSDGDKGDVTVSGSGATWTIDADSVALGGITLGTSYGGGALSAVLYRSLLTIPNQLANSAVLVTLPSPGIRIYPGTCIWMVLRGTATAASVSGSYTIMER